MIPDKELTTLKGISDTNFWGEDTGPAKVDFYIAKAIQLLNDKGYKTNCCCSGHIRKFSKCCPKKDFFMTGYIWFACDLPSAPNGWYLDENKMISGGDTIRYESKATIKMLKKKMAKLMRWVKALPDRS